MLSGRIEGFSVQNADQLLVPVLVSVPHAGRDYPPEIFDNLRLPPTALLRLEDRYADLLARTVLAKGVPTIIAHRARAWIDLNRDEDDIDVAMITGLTQEGRPAPGAKQRGGLGLIPRRLSGSGDIWKHPISQAALASRVDKFHRPYHATVADILARMRHQFGVAILLDLHSMPPVAIANDTISPDFVIGDRFGRSAANRYSELLVSRLRNKGFETALNHPYSGEYILRRHGNVSRNIHAIQLEVDRSLYLDATLREPAKNLQKIAVLVEEIVQMLGDEAISEQTLLAAE
jgi:N-formylglutamate amidohydrolase